MQEISCGLEKSTRIRARERHVAVAPGIAAAQARVRIHEGSSIVSPDGIEIVSHFRTPVPSDFISALIVSVQQVANKIVHNAQAGSLMQTMIEASEGKFFVQVVELGYLVVLADSQANTGLIRVEIAQVSPLIK